MFVFLGYMIHTFKSNMVYKNQPITKKADNRRHITKPTIKKNIEQGNDNKPVGHLLLKDKNMLTRSFYKSDAEQNTQYRARLQIITKY